MRTTPRRTTALMASAVLALGGLTAACEDDGDGIDDDVEQDVEEDVNNVQDELDGEPDDGGPED